MIEDGISPELDKAVANLEVYTNAAIKRILIVNDVYGNHILRQTVLDEMNALLRECKKCLNLMQPESTSGNYMQGIVQPSQ